METMELLDLDNLIDDLEARITETQLPDAAAATVLCASSLLCGSALCGSALLCVTDRG